MSLKRSVYLIAKRIRRAPLLSRLNWLWFLLRYPYSKMLALGGPYVPMTMGGVEVHVPPEFVGITDWETYEAPAMKRAAQWIQAAPQPLVVDVGCSVGVFTLMALSASPEAEVISIDPDLNGLRYGQRMWHMARARCKPIHAFISDEDSTGDDFADAVARTTTLLAAPGAQDGCDKPEYRSLDNRVPDVPVYTLDRLLESYPEIAKRSVLVKCDVEGAEMLVMQGARRILKSLKPTLLLSVHPEGLKNFGSSAEELKGFLNDLNYQTELISIDHEEHWWCSRSSSPDL